MFRIKKFSSLVLSLIMLMLCFASCDKNADDTSVTDNPTEDISYESIERYTPSTYEKKYFSIIDNMKNADTVEAFEEYKQTLDDMIQSILKTVEGDVTEPEVCKHESVYSDGIGATCTESGLLRDVCFDCGEVISETYMEAFGHQYADGQCMVCGEKDVIEEK